MLSHVLFFNDTATTEIYTLSLHDALPICSRGPRTRPSARWERRFGVVGPSTRGCCSRYPSDCALDLDAFCVGPADRKSTRLNSSHANISYAVFCLKKKKAT